MVFFVVFWFYKHFCVWSIKASSDRMAFIAVIAFGDQGADGVCLIFFFYITCSGKKLQEHKTICNAYELLTPR